MINPIKPFFRDHYFLCKGSSQLNRVINADENEFKVKITLNTFNGQVG